MGCSISQSNKSRRYFVLRKEDTKFTLELSSKGHKVSQISCLKIEIQPSLHPILTQNIQEIPILQKYFENYMIYINFIKNSYAKLESSENYFRFVTHSCCVNSDLHNSIKVMLVSISSSGRGQLYIDFIPKIPFFVASSETLTEETLIIYGAWKEYCCVLVELMETKDPTLDLQECAKRLKELLEDFDLHHEYFLNINYAFFKELLRSTVVLAQRMDRKVKKTILKLKAFFSGFIRDDEEIALLGVRAFNLRIFKGKEIVHLIIIANEACK